MRQTLFATARRPGVTILSALLLLALAAGAARAQEGTVAGQVLSGTTAEPVSGAQVFIPGTSLGALTDADGRYRIAGVPPGQTEVRVSMIGQRAPVRTVTVQAEQTVTADFELEVSAISLDEVIVTATGEQRRREVGNALGKIDAEQLSERRAPASLDDLLQGQATGVTIRKSSGSLGTGNDLKIRGVTSITLDNTPLVYIDGARVSNNNEQEGGPPGFNEFFVGGQTGSRLNDLNPEDIESIEIVKGPSAATLYGTEAAAGVILIQTKRGREGETRWNFRAETGVTRDVTEWPDVAYNPTFSQLAPLPGAKDTVYTMNLLEGENPGIDDPFRNGLQQGYGGSVRGGVSGISYYGSAEFRDDEGNLPANDFTQWGVRANLSASPSDKVDIDISNGFISNQVRLPDNDNNGSGYAGNALLAPGFNAPFDRVDPFGDGNGETVRTCPLAFELARLGEGDLATLSEQNCVAPFLSLAFDDVGLIRNTQNIERYTGSGTLTFRPFDFLTNRATVGYDQFTEETGQLTPVEPRLIPTSQAFAGALESFVNRNANLTLEGTSAASYGLTERLAAVTTVGAQFNRERIEGLAASGTEFPAGSPSIGNAVTTNTSDFTIETRTLGLFVQQQFSWNDRLFVTPAVRFDDNSAVGDELDVQTLPRVQVSWLASEEPWFPGFFQQFRFRGAWGESGVQPATNAARGILNAVSSQVGGQEVLGVTPAQPANPVLAAARSQEFEGGFDASFLRDRLGLEFTYYDQTSRDDVVDADLAPSLGFPDEQFVNIGEIRSRGIEVALDATALQRERFRWDVRTQLTVNDGEIVELNNPIVFGLGGSSQRHVQGFPFGSYVTEEVIVDPETGEARVLTCDEDPTDCIPDPGSPTGFAGDNRFFGHPTPEWEGSVSTTVSFLEDAIQLYGLLDFQGGHQLFNGTEEFRAGFVAGLPTQIFEKGPDGELTDDAKIKRHAAAINSEGPWFEDATFAKLRTVSLRFQLPESWVRPISARNASLTLAGENLATFTDYSGLDPEVNFSGAEEALRADFLTLPPAQTFFARVSLGF